MISRNAKSSDTNVSPVRTRGKAAIAKGKSWAPKNRQHKNGVTNTSSKATANSVKLQDITNTTQNSSRSLNTGRWTKTERLAFLRGLRRHGKSKWKAIARGIATRDTTQTKTHAQSMLKTLGEGQNIFAELEEHERLLASKENSRGRDSGTKQTGNRASKTTKSATASTKWRQIDFDGATALLELKWSIGAI